MSDEPPEINMELARQVQAAGLDAIEEREEEPMATIEALMLGTLSLARTYMPAEELAEYLYMVADHVTDGEEEEDGEASPPQAP